MTAEILKDAATDAAKDVAENIVETGHEVFGQAKTHAAEAASQAGAAIREGVEARAEAGKDMFAEEGRRLARSLRDVAAEQGESTLKGRLLDTVASGVADVSEGLRGRSFGSLLEQADSFARRNPGAFVAGAALAGFALARFARSSGAPPVAAASVRTAGPATARRASAPRKTTAELKS